MTTPNQHPGNDYYVQPTTGNIQQQDNSFFAALLKAAGYQGPMTWDQAQGVLALGKKVTQQNGPATPTSTGGTIDQTGADVTATANSAFGALSDLGKIGAVLKSIYDAVTNGKMWRSLGWLLLGIILIIFGLIMWLGKDAVKSLGPALPVIGGFL